jgi:hypothetical protein
MSLRVIFHVPYPLEHENPKGGAVRPTRMLRAFEQWGEVVVIEGNAAQRKRLMAGVRARIRAGERFDLCYSESSTMPTALTEPHHLPTHPLLDFAFFRFLRGHGVPVGLFYRDIQWRFPMYGQGMDPVRKAAAMAMYRYDLAAYARVLDVLFLPSLEMADEFPLPDVEVAALPPGHEVTEVPPVPVSDRLELFYVGGVGPNYRLDEFLRAVQQTPQVRLTLCTRANEWEAVRERYRPVTGDNLALVHASAEDLAPLFAGAHVGITATEPQPYWRFAAPLKMYEYLGNGLPQIASEGSLAGGFVSRNQIGWTEPYRSDDFARLLRELCDSPQLVAQARERVLEVRTRHGWLQRAEQVVEVLRGRLG